MTDDPVYELFDSPLPEPTATDLHALAVGCYQRAIGAMAPAWAEMEKMAGAMAEFGETMMAWFHEEANGYADVGYPFGKASTAWWSGLTPGMRRSLDD